MPMIESILIASLVCTAINIGTMVGMIGFKVRVFGDMYLPTFVRKPLYDCLPCMASLWGTLTIGILLDDYGIYTHKLIISVLATSGLNAIISMLINDTNDPEDTTYFDESWGV